MGKSEDIKEQFQDVRNGLSKGWETAKDRISEQAEVLQDKAENNMAEMKNRK